MIQIDMPMPEKCSDCIFCDDNCSCVASEYDGLGINVGCAYRTGRRDIRCPLKEKEVQKFFVDESGKITPLPVVVRCKDCKYLEHMYALDELNGKKCYVCRKHTFTGLREEEWYCADGERKVGE